jgi:hypothetical protein
MSDYFRRLAETLAGYGGKTFGGNTFGGQTFGGNTFGGNTFGASANPPQQPPVTVQATLPQPPPAYTQPFAGPHNAPYSLPQYQTPPFNPNGGATSYMPPMNLPNPNPVNPQTMPSVSSIDRQVAQANPPPPVSQVPPPQASTMPPSQPGMMGMNGDVPMGMEMQGMKAPQPQGRNELERDFFNQLAQNPHGFDKPGWLSRWLG